MHSVPLSGGEKSIMCLILEGRRAFCTSFRKGEGHYIPPSGGEKGILYLLPEGRSALFASFRRGERHTGHVRSGRGQIKVFLPFPGFLTYIVTVS